jgi:ferric-dicitrate binding protein FerR (iron transport regulator)
MNDNKNISEEENSEQQEFFKKVEIPFTRSKEEVWDTLSKKIEKEDFVQAQGKLISMVWYQVAAAVVILLVGSTSFMRLYSTVVFADKGKHIHHFLPDGSSVELNAASTISYHPYWWRFKRDVTLDGEAFFEVKKGTQFIVESRFGKTEVLGTSFNINTRNKAYKVFCKTGKVKVSNSSSSVALLITPGKIAVLDLKNNTGKVENRLSDHVISWRLNEFYFDAKPLKEVVEEIEIQYNVSITLADDISEGLIYSGRFTKKGSADVALELLCQTFNLNFTSIEKNSYNLSSNN